MDELENTDKPPEKAVELRRWQWWILRVVIALLFGLVLFWITLSTGRSQVQWSPLADKQGHTHEQIRLVEAIIEDYKEQNHHLPPSLAVLEKYGYDLTDGWGRPLIYTVQGTKYTIISYGQDGKPGGTGWDTDITSNNLSPANMEISYHQLWTDPRTHEIVRTIVITSILGALLCLVTVRPWPLTRIRIWGLIAQIGLTLLAAIYIGAFITELHVPSGH